MIEQILAAFPDNTEITSEVVKAIITFSRNLVLAIVILIAGFWAAGFMAKLVRRAFNKTRRIDDTITEFLASVARYAVVIITILAILSQFGVETASIIAVLGAATLAIGLALQGTLGNVASGVVLLITRPYHIGDLVEINGETGTVERLDIFSSRLNTLDNKALIIPNGQVVSSTIINYTANDTRRFEINVGIDYDDDINLAIKTLIAAAAQDERVLAEPAPWAGAVEFGQSSIDMKLRAWTDKDDYWQTRTDTVAAVKKALDEAGLNIPYPHQVELQKQID